MGLVLGLLGLGTVGLAGAEPICVMWSHGTGATSSPEWKQLHGYATKKECEQATREYVLAKQREQIRVAEDQAGKLVEIAQNRVSSTEARIATLGPLVAKYTRELAAATLREATAKTLLAANIAALEPYRQSPMSWSFRITWATPGNAVKIMVSWGPDKSVCESHRLNEVTFQKARSGVVASECRRITILNGGTWWGFTGVGHGDYGHAYSERDGCEVSRKKVFKDYTECAPLSIIDTQLDDQLPARLYEYERVVHDAQTNIEGIQQALAEATLALSAARVALQAAGGTVAQARATAVRDARAATIVTDGHFWMNTPDGAGWGVDYVCLHVGVDPLDQAARRPGTIPYTPGSPIFVDVRLNGRTVARLVLDTGADSSVVSPRLLAVAGVDMTQPGGRVALVGVAGNAKAFYYPVDIDVAGHRARLNVTAHALADGGDGLLGRDFLDRFKVVMDPVSRTVTLVPR